MKRVISLCARMESSRYPGKTMADIAGRPALVFLAERLKHVNAEVVIVTGPDDVPIQKVASVLDLRCVVGVHGDMMAQHWRVAQATDADVIALAGADDPLLDPQTFRDVFREFGHWYSPDYVRTRGWPLGMNVWAWNREAMEVGYEKAVAPEERHHVIPYWERRPHRWKIGTVSREPDAYDVRVTLDTPEDREVISAIAVALRNVRDFGVTDVLRQLELHPDWAEINKGQLHGLAARDVLYDLTPVEEGVLV